MADENALDSLAVELLGKTANSLSAPERRVIERIHRREITGHDMGVYHEKDSTFGQRLADHVAAVGGSWGFIIAFAIVLFGWMLLNSKALGFLGVHFDPFPFIFLNLMLSTLAAIQAPIIMMSQNRQAVIDRRAAGHDYEVNLRAELEIIRLHEKINKVQHDLTALMRGQREGQIK
jgi:uncharacterized membrane protein